MEELIGKANTAGAFILQKSIKDSLKKFFSSTGKDFIFIERCKSCDDVKQYFHTIKKKLNKSNNPIYSDIPEDDDLSIIKGYLLFTTPTKILVSEDEHFWGYSTEIETKYNIKIFHEKDCGTIPF